MQAIHDIGTFDHNKIKEDKFWNAGESKELLMHRIHAYPAKFPAFLTPKIVQHLQKIGHSVESIADIFCGCGTSALESRILGIDFWGYDINPVATLITKAKSQAYDNRLINHYFLEISQLIKEGKMLTPNKFLFHERLNYWFSYESIVQLYRILKSIKSTCPDGKYKTFFLTAFSNILKPSSKWLTKSIKPQIDPFKKPTSPLLLFRQQVELMMKANVELRNTVGNFNSAVDIQTKNILTIRPTAPYIDLVITSPPYVTSYEYADLHQLSTIWLGYVNDYKDLRKGTIGSEYQSTMSLENDGLNCTGSAIVKKLAKIEKLKAKAVKKYFEDMERTVKQTKKIVKKSGYAAFVIGDTKYKGISIDNAKYLTNCLIDENFSDIKITKRKISSKILTPYRDKYGQFSNDSKGKKVYSHEYLIIAKK